MNADQPPPPIVNVQVYANSVPKVERIPSEPEEGEPTYTIDFGPHLTAFVGEDDLLLLAAGILRATGTPDMAIDLTEVSP